MECCLHLRPLGSLQSLVLEHSEPGVPLLDSAPSRAALGEGLSSMLSALMQLSRTYLCCCVCGASFFETRSDTATCCVGCPDCQGIALLHCVIS